MIVDLGLEWGIAILGVILYGPTSANLSSEMDRGAPRDAADALVQGLLLRSPVSVEPLGTARVLVSDLDRQVPPHRIIPDPSHILKFDSYGFS